MSGFHNPLAPRSNTLQAKSAEIKRWVRQLLELPDDTPVTVAELACRDDGCPDIETVIGVMEAEKSIQTFRVHVALADADYSTIADNLDVRGVR